MDKVIVTGLLVIGAVTAAVVVIMTLGPSIGRSSQSAVEGSTEAAKRLATSIEIIAVAPNPDGTRIDAWVQNVGSATIDRVDKSNVFLIKAGPKSRFDRMIYDDSTVTSLIWSGDLKEAELPWNRADTLHVTIALTGSDVMNTGDHVFRFSTPNGVTDEQVFSKEE